GPRARQQPTAALRRAGPGRPDRGPRPTVGDLPRPGTRVASGRLRGPGGSRVRPPARSRGPAPLLLGLGLLADPFPHLPNVPAHLVELLALLLQLRLGVAPGSHVGGARVS